MNHTITPRSDNNYYTIYTIRYRNGIPSNTRIVEHENKWISRTYTGGFNIITYLNTSNEQGYGSYYKYTQSTTPINNYPVESFDSFNANDYNRYYYNYNDSTSSTDTPLVIFNSNNLCGGTRFYGIKIYESDNTVVFNGIPVIKSSSQALYDDVSGKIYYPTIA